MSKFKSGFVSIIGETNAGKSTLLNSIMGEKVAIVSPKVQTTRTKIKGIYTDENKQIVFMDTPGIHKVNSKLSGVMIETAVSSLKDSNIILYVISGNKKELSPFDYNILKELRSLRKKEEEKNAKRKEEKREHKKIICIINKIDRIKKEIILAKIAELNQEFDFDAIIPISALNSEGVKELMVEIEKQLPEGPKYYPEDDYTDQTVRQMCEEIIRGKALKLLNEEVPHGLYVEIEKFEETVTNKGEEIVNIETVIYTKKSSHKGIIVGKNGEMLKKIGIYARQDIENFLGVKVNVKTWVKVRKNWLDNDLFLNKFKDV